jgi:hypothetical protein
MNRKEKKIIWKKKEKEIRNVKFIQLKFYDHDYVMMMKGFLNDLTTTQNFDKEMLKFMNI